MSGWQFSEWIATNGTLICSDLLKEIQFRNKILILFVIKLNAIYVVIFRCFLRNNGRHGHRPFFKGIVLLLHQSKIDWSHLWHASSARFSACLQRLRDNKHAFGVFAFAAEHGQEAMSESAIHGEIEHRVNAAHNNLLWRVSYSISFCYPRENTEPTLSMATMSRVASGGKK